VLKELLHTRELMKGLGTNGKYSHKFKWPEVNKCDQTNKELVNMRSQGWKQLKLQYPVNTAWFIHHEDCITNESQI
jgi:hypothetical protein